MSHTTHPSQQTYQVFLGIDISKSWFDLSIWIPVQPLLLHRRFSNDRQGCKQAWKYLQKHIDLPEDQWLFCMEATGLYTRPLVHYLMAKSLAVWVASSLDIKRSTGLIRGKNDKIDAQRIAQYAATHQQRCRLLIINQLSLEKLQKQRKRSQQRKFIHLAVPRWW